MARPAKALPTPADDGFNPERLEEAGEAAKQLAVIQSQQEATVRAVAAQLGYQLPADCTDPDLIQRDIAANMRRTAEAMVQVGLGLICLKEACQHGEFLARLEVLRFEPRVAQRYMQVAKKLSNASTSSHLLKVIDSQSKLLELIVLDDEHANSCRNLAVDHCVGKSHGRKSPPATASGRAEPRIGQQQPCDSFKLREKSCRKCDRALPRIERHRVFEVLLGSRMEIYLHP